jgi:chemosensory pili system protein ChpA (sensor histidine kinase/response regulator)
MAVRAAAPVPAVSTPAPVASATDDGWDDSPTVVPMSPDDELAAVFQAEAREALTNLRGYLTRLEHQPGDREAATQCARLLHLLKGAAASVGLDAISDRARDLHAQVERSKTAGFDAASVAALGTAVEAFIGFAIPDLASTGRTSHEAAPAPPTTIEVVDEEPRRIFREEAQSAIAEARQLLIQVRDSAGSTRGVFTSRIERIMHRLKGSALIVGEAQAAALASRGQALCEALDRVDPGALGNVIDQIGAIALVPGIRSPSRSGSTVVRVHLPPRDEWDAYIEESSELLDNVERTLGLIEGSDRPTVELSNLFRTYHTLKGATNAVGLTPIGQHLHIIEAFLERLVASAQLTDLRYIVHALSEQNVAVRNNIVRASTEGEVTADHERVQTQLAALGQARGAPEASWISPADSAWFAGGPEVERPLDRGEAPSAASEHESRPSVDGSNAESRDAREPPEAAQERRFVRVPADRLDNLLDLAGELVVCRSRMVSRVNRMLRLQDDDSYRHEGVISLIDGFAGATQFTNLDGRRRRLAGAAGTALAGSVTGFGSLEMDQYEEIHVLSRRLDEAASDIGEVRREIGAEMSALVEDAEMLSTIASGLQNEITRARMLTVDTLFTRLRLPIRDAAQRSAREVEIVTAGDQLAIDKSMSDVLFGPLLHMVRNAVVHGIERPADRELRGKPRAGTISLRASQIHGEIVLEIADDGAGIDLAKLRQAGIRRGLVPADIPDDDPRVIDLVFARGVSTLDTVDDVAGRGMGGNVLKRAIDRLNGTIQITTQPGRGTLFRIALPLSMAITQAILVRVGGVLLAIPIVFAETIALTASLEVVDSFGRARIRLGDRMLAMRQTWKIFEPRMLRTPPTHKMVVVCVVGGERIAVLVDEVIGQEEIVVKSLGMIVEGHPLFSGATSRGDGELALIMDIPGMLEAEATGERRIVHAVRGAAGAAPLAPAGAAVPLPVAPQGSGGIAAATAPEPAHERLDTDPDSRAPRDIELGEVAALPAGRLRVLFVDDSLSVRKVAERMLTGLDVDVISAVDGLDALDKLRAMAFSLVFTDLEMPRMHGYELIREMQLLPAYQDIPVVVISSRSGQKHIDQALAMGAREYLTKPFSPEILAEVLGRLARPGT